MKWIKHESTASRHSTVFHTKTVAANLTNELVDYPARRFRRLFAAFDGARDTGSVAGRVGNAELS